MAEKFEILSARDHTRKRTGMYLGSTSIESVDRFLLGQWTTVQYVPALNKMIDEIIDNCIDEAIRTKFKYANEITVTIRNNKVTVVDNGRGIPQDKISDSETNTTILRPVAAWTRVNAGTSFDSERTTIGANGVGSACVNFMSKHFVGMTTSAGNCVKVVSKDGALDTKVTISVANGHGTSVEFIPDFSLLAIDNFDDLHTIEIVEDRLAGLQVAFPEIKFKFNGKLVKGTTLKKYAALFTNNEEDLVAVQRDKLSFFFCPSEDGFRSTSYINGVNTRLGGAYNDYIANSVVDELMKSIKRKYKVEVGKSTIKSGLTFVLFARDFTDPKYDSQTKERLTNTIGEVKRHFDAADSLTIEQIAKKIMLCNGIIEPIVEAQLAKKLAADKRAATLAQKKLKRVKVAKHIAATKPGGTLFLCEGDCIAEDTELHVLGVGTKKIKDICVGDMVMTHKHRYRAVVSTSHAIKNGIKLNGIIYSSDHRLYVYNTLTDTFEFLEVANINQHVHKLVKNRLIEHGIDNAIHVVRSVTNTGIVTTDRIKMRFSETHEILKIINSEITVTTVFALSIGDTIIL